VPGARLYRAVVEPSFLLAFIAEPEAEWVVDPAGLSADNVWLDSQPRPRPKPKRVVYPSDPQTLLMCRHAEQTLIAQGWTRDAGGNMTEPGGTP
jgi:hypothetical protein